MLEKGEKRPGRATTFWATDKLIKLAEHFGVPLDNISDHFKPEPPHNPLVLRGHSSGIGRNKKPGPIIKNYERTETTRRLEADIRELNAFLAGCEISINRFVAETISSFDIPLSCSLQQLWSAPSALEQCTEIAHGIGITEIRCLFVPALGSLVILRNARAGFAHCGSAVVQINRMKMAALSPASPPTSPRARSLQRQRGIALAPPGALDRVLALQPQQVCLGAIALINGHDLRPMIFRPLPLASF